MDISDPLGWSDVNGVWDMQILASRDNNTIRVIVNRLTFDQFLSIRNAESRVLPKF